MALRNHAHGSLTPVLINHQLIGNAVQCPKNIPIYGLLAKMFLDGVLWVELRYTCIIHQYATVSIGNFPSKIATWKIAIQPNRPISKNVKERKSAFADRHNVVRPYWPVIGAMEKYWKKMPKKSART